MRQIPYGDDITTTEENRPMTLPIVRSAAAAAAGVELEGHLWLMKIVWG